MPISGDQPVAFTGNTNGTVSLYTATDGALVDTGRRLTPFAGYGGALRVASGDFNGDGVTDYAFTTGAGPQAVVQLMNGRDGAILVGQTVIFQGFRGGLFLAAADIDRDGKAELVVSADAGAGPHIQTFRVAGGALQLQSSFFAFDNPAFRGGAGSRRGTSTATGSRTWSSPPAGRRSAGSRCTAATICGRESRRDWCRTSSRSRVCGPG